jgi:hypothetical protein
VKFEAEFRYLNQALETISRSLFDWAWDAIAKTQLNDVAGA